MFSHRRIEGIVVQLLEKSVIEPPGDVIAALRNALKTEDGDVARQQLSAILENIKLAVKKRVPVCQDTGIPLFYVNVGGNVRADVNTLHEAIISGVRRGTREIPLRPNVVDPLSRKNLGKNIGKDMPHIEFTFTPKRSYIEITVLPKGAGSENMSALAMLKPSEGIKGVKRFVLETAARASGNPCPPTIIGVGIGGSADIALAIAKKAAMRPVSMKNGDRALARLESELKDAVNKLGVGPMGLGGRTTCLAVHVEKAGCHTASLPVGVNMQCWAGRRATVRIFKDRVEWME